MADCNEIRDRTGIIKYFQNFELRLRIFSELLVKDYNLDELKKLTSKKAMDIHQALEELIQSNDVVVYQKGSKIYYSLKNQQKVEDFLDSLQDYQEDSKSE